MDDSLIDLRVQYEREIAMLEQHLSALKLKLKTLNGFLFEAQSLVMPDPQSIKYANCGLTEAILDAVASLCLAGKGTASGVTPSQIRSYIIHHGFPLPATTRNFVIAVNTVLFRLARSNRLGRIKTFCGIFYQPLKQVPMADTSTTELAEGVKSVF